MKGQNWPLSDTENIVKISRYFLNIAISRYFQMMQYIAFAIYRDTKRSSLVQSVHERRFEGALELMTEEGRVQKAGADGWVVCSETDGLSLMETRGWNWTEAHLNGAEADGLSCPQRSSFHRPILSPPTPQQQLGSC